MPQILEEIYRLRWISVEQHERYQIHYKKGQASVLAAEEVFRYSQDVWDLMENLEIADRALSGGVKANSF